MSSSIKRDYVQSQIKAILLEFFGLELEAIDPSDSFISLGLNPLSLSRLSHVIQNNFDISISYRHLADDISTPVKLIEEIKERLGEDGVTELERRAHHEELKAIMTEQLRIMSMQLNMLTGALDPSTYLELNEAAKSSMFLNAINASAPSSLFSHGSKSHLIPTANGSSTAHGSKFDSSSFGSYTSSRAQEESDLSQQQQDFLHSFIDHFTTKTATSKQFAAQHRTHLANPSGIYGFKKVWKELVYPLSIRRSEGAKLWDVDDHQYIDLSMENGNYFFGHSPDFIREVLYEQLDNSHSNNSPYSLAGDVAQLLCEMSGQDRASFYSSGDEAVITAIRLARLYTKKTKIIFFNDASHGNFDQVLVQSVSTNRTSRMLPKASGIPDAIAQQAIVLDLGAESTSDILRLHGDEIACIILDVGQCIQADHSLTDYILELRVLTQKLGIVLILDEGVAGFRISPTGSQEYFNVDADLITYGSILGGNLQIGALTGKEALMDGLDGGLWNYGDQSIPESNITYSQANFAPLPLSAAKAVLHKLKNAGPSLQEEMSLRAELIVEELNTFFAERSVPISLSKFFSSFQFNYVHDVEHIELLYFKLLEKGIFTTGLHVPCYLSTVHTDEDITFIVEATKEAIVELQEGGFFLPRPGHRVLAHSDPASPPQPNKNIADGIEPSLEEIVEAKDNQQQETEDLKDSEQDQGQTTEKSPELPDERDIRVELSAPHESDVEEVLEVPDEEHIIGEREGLEEQLNLEVEHSVEVQDSLDIEEHPLTEGQSEVWITSLIGDEASCAFNKPFKISFVGELNVQAMMDSINQVVLRHESFRLRFYKDKNSQYVAEDLPLNIEHIDLKEKDSSFQKERLVDEERKLAVTPFDLYNGPLIRVVFLEFSSEEYVLLLSSHQLVCDAWSWNVVLKEISVHYNSLVSDTIPSLDESPLFTDFVSFENKQKQSEHIQASYEYWSQQFSSPPPALELPIDYPRPGVKSYQGATLKHKLDSNLFEEAKKLASEQSISLFTLLFSTFNILLSRLSGQQDLVVVIPSAGQLQFGEETLVGHCANLLPVRLEFDGKYSASEFLKLASSQILDAYEHQVCTLGGILKHTSTQRDPSRLPLAEVMFNLRWDSSEIDFVKLDHSVDSSPISSTYFDLYFNFIDRDSQGLYLDLDYNAHLFEEATIRRWIYHFEALLHGIAINPNSSVSLLPLTPTSSQDIYRSAFTDTETPYPHTATVHELFEQRALLSPDTIALEFEETKLTYRELNEYSNQFAQYLIDLGVAPNDLVGVHMERSAGMLVALLGILKVKAAYVPLDPSYPSERIRYLVEDSKLSFFLSERNILEAIDTSAFPQHVIVVCLDDERTKITQHSKERPNLEYSSDQLAYVIYTSGSTGHPKGVEITHKSLVNFLCSMQKEPGFSSEDILLSVTTLSFDIAGLELYLPIISGGRVVVLSREIAMDGALLADAIEEHRTTVMQATPTTWRLLIESGWKGKQDLKILCGGETLPQPLAHKLVNMGSSLWNMYGPTETTIWSSVYEINRDEPVILIGRPIANTQFYILDDYLQLVPPGSIGKLYIGGDGLARGYHRREKLTEERFIPHPFASASGETLYNTGDLARMHPRGDVEFIGRNDSQVKVRGYRIELGEIECAMNSLPFIAESACHVFTDDNSDKKIIGYYKLQNSENPEQSALRAALRDTLPKYMIPSLFIQLDSFPLTPNGKIDRTALPKPDQQQRQNDTSFIAPRTPTEQLIADTWTDVLNVPRVSIHDNFFDLGGHSLQATRVITRLREPTKLDLSIRAFFEHPTVAELALLITELQANQEDADDILQIIEELEELSEDEISALLRESES